MPINRPQFPLRIFLPQLSLSAFFSAPVKSQTHCRSLTEVSWLPSTKITGSSVSLSALSLSDLAVEKGIFFPSCCEMLILHSKRMFPALKNLLFSHIWPFVSCNVLQTWKPTLYTLGKVRGILWAQLGRNTKQAGFFSGFVRVVLLFYSLVRAAVNKEPSRWVLWFKPSHKPEQHSGKIIPYYWFYICLYFRSSA